MSLQGRIIPITILTDEAEEEAKTKKNSNNNQEETVAESPTPDENGKSIPTIDDEEEEKVDEIIEEASSSTSSNLSGSKRKSDNEISASKIPKQDFQEESKMIESAARFVPISLPDGRVLHRDPDETMEIRTEFTNFCHQEFSDDAPNQPGRISPTPPPPPPPPHSRIVPITLANGEEFMPNFTTLDDVKPPDWSAFSNQSTEPKREKIIPLRIENQDEVEVPKQSIITSSDASPPRTKLPPKSRKSRERAAKRGQHTVIKINGKSLILVFN